MPEYSCQKRIKCFPLLIHIIFQFFFKIYSHFSHIWQLYWMYQNKGTTNHLPLSFLRCSNLKIFPIQIDFLFHNAGISAIRNTGPPFLQNTCPELLWTFRTHIFRSAGILFMYYFSNFWIFLVDFLQTIMYSIRELNMH